MAGECCGRCSTKACGADREQGCGPTPALDRRRFLVDLTRYAMASASVGIAGVGGIRKAAADAPEPMVNSLGMQLVHVPSGTFRMGSEDSDDEKPSHEVTISRPLWVAVCETSNADYRAFVAGTGHAEPGVAVPSKKKVTPWQNRMFSADEQPVVCVTWDDAVAFCEWLSGKEGAHYRLPTEAEWEYVARAGAQTRFYWGDEPDGREKAYFAEEWPEETKQAEDWQETPWGLCTTDLRLTKRVNPDIGARRLANLLRGWSIELKDILGGLGVNAIESLRGNRLHLRGIGLTDTELEILGVRMAGS